MLQDRAGAELRGSARESHPRHAGATIKDLLSYRLHVAANLVSRGAALRYRREFGVSLWEWRSIALVGAHAPLSLAELAKAAGLDKGQLSRVVSGLASRGIVSRVTDANDARGVRLSLTREGERLYDGLIRAANERNAAFLACLSEHERQYLDRVLVKLVRQAQALIQKERALAPRARTPVQARRRVRTRNASQPTRR